MRLSNCNIVLLCVILSLFVPYVYPTGNKEEPRDDHTNDEHTITFPFVLSNSKENLSVLPGAMVVVVIETELPNSVSIVLKKDDKVLVRSPLISADKKSFALLGIPHTLSSGEYSITADSNDDHVSINASPKTLRVKERKFFVEEVLLSQKLTKQRTESSSNLEIVVQAKEIWNLTGTMFRFGRYAYDMFILPVVDYKHFTGMFADKRTYAYADGRHIDSVAHGGIDIAARAGIDVIAPAAGRVVMVKNRIVTGKTIVISHFPGIFSLYHHLSSTNDTKEGDIVQAGEKIGKVGSTGFSTGSHVHWEIRVNNIKVDPLLMMGGLDKIVILPVQYTYN